MDLSRPLNVITLTVDADVLAVLAGATASFTGRRVHQVAGRHSERGVRNALHRLCEQGIVSRERVGSADCYTLNRAHLAAPHIEALAQLRGEFLRRIRAEVGDWPVAAEYVAIFGSAARGDMRPDSDIDLFVVRPDGTAADDDRWQQQLATLADHVTAWTGNEARPFELTPKQIRAGRSGGEPVLTDIRDEGVTVHGPTSYLRTEALRPGGHRA